MVWSVLSNTVTRPYLYFRRTGLASLLLLSSLFLRQLLSSSHQLVGKWLNNKSTISQIFVLYSAHWLAECCADVSTFEFFRQYSYHNGFIIPNKKQEQDEKEAEQESYSRPEVRGRLLQCVAGWHVTPKIRPCEPTFNPNPGCYIQSNINLQTEGSSRFFRHTTLILIARANTAYINMTWNRNGSEHTWQALGGILSKH